MLNIFYRYNLCSGFGGHASSVDIPQEENFHRNSTHQGIKQVGKRLSFAPLLYPTSVTGVIILTFVSVCVCVTTHTAKQTDIRT